MAIAAVAAFGIVASMASAAARLPQIVFNSATLQSHLNALGESINVRTQQQDVVSWGLMVSSGATLNLWFRQTGTSSCDQIGIARLNAFGNTVLGLITVIPGTTDDR